MKVSTTTNRDRFIPVVDTLEHMLKILMGKMGGDHVETGQQLTLTLELGPKKSKHVCGLQGYTTNG